MIVLVLVLSVDGPSEIIDMLVPVHGADLSERPQLKRDNHHHSAQM